MNQNRMTFTHAFTEVSASSAAGGPGSTGPVAVREMMFAAIYIVLFSTYGIYLLRSDRRFSHDDA